jgi:hypothetical protein
MEEGSRIIVQDAAIIYGAASAPAGPDNIRNFNAGGVGKPEKACLNRLREGLRSKPLFTLDLKGGKTGRERV